MFDFKKENKALYQPATKPHIIKVPQMKFLALQGKGNPNDLDGAYHRSIPLLYGVAYTLKMSYKTLYKIDGFFQYVVPPLEGFWWIDGLKGMDLNRKNELQFILLIRLPDFIEEKDVFWAIETVSKKKGIDYRQVELMVYDEGWVVQALHIGPYDTEIKTVNQMHALVEKTGFRLDFSQRYHHEIYISDPRKVNPEKLKTILRHPIQKVGVENE